MLRLYVPKYEDLRFRQELLADPDTMAYNHAYGGIISFPEEKWSGWYDKWVVNPKGRFYRYLEFGDTVGFVGETAYHFDEEREIYISDIIVKAEHRGKGFGKQGLRMLCDAARENGISVLYDDIAIDNPSVKLFLDSGFYEDYRTDEFIMLKRDLSMEL